MSSQPLIDSVLAEIWRFVRGDADVSDFEQWLYANSDEFSARLGDEGLLEVISANYQSADDVARVKAILRDHANRVSPLPCRCLTLPNHAVVDMGNDSDEVLASFEERQTRGDPVVALVRRVLALRSVVARRTGGATERCVLPAPFEPCGG